MPSCSRRAALYRCALVGAVGVAGCLGRYGRGDDRRGGADASTESRVNCPDDGSVTACVEDVVLLQGESGTATVLVRHASTVQVFPPETFAESLPPSHASPVEMGLGIDEASVRPRPDGTMESYPPYWQWDEPRDRVTAELPVFVESTAPPGSYRYGVEARPRDVSADRRPVTANGTIDVTERT
ncbi:hypothetical protein ACFQPA_04145 [Halomarina halobia]|uniref:Uncharacterized protein n=1 Tax=Halomarina halobia TaxID=3033386 RepID=A0ABD6A6M8_9EURY|nr:hypothetical protein [Halomarina sp. PSR21]